MKSKLLIFAGAFAFWLVGDLWTKHWADVTLGDAFHPVTIQISDTQAGKSLGEVLSERTGVDAAELTSTVLPYTRLLAAPVDLKTEDGVFRDDSAGAKSFGFYVFWRGLDAPPRRVDKTEPIYLMRWLSAAFPDKTREDIRALARKHLHTVTFPQWLAKRIPKVDVEDFDELAKGHIFPVARRPARPTADVKVQAGQIYIVEHRRIDVMGSWSRDAGDTGRKAAPWFQFLYAENPGAAFGFMGGIPEAPRQWIFFILTCIAFAVIIGIAINLPPNVWWLFLALGSVLAGATGNFVDRVRYGYVIDFIDMHLGFMHWPTYNVADIAIAVGVGLLLVDMLFNKNSPLVKEAVEPAKSATTSDGAV